MNLDSIKDELARIVGVNNISENYFYISQYCMTHIAKNIFNISTFLKPKIVVRPTNVEQLKSIIRFLYEKEIPMFIRGSGTGYSGSEIPTEDGVVIETTGLNKIINIDKENKTVTVQSGIKIKELNQKLSEEGLWWPHDPESKEFATVGGAVSTSGIGTFATKYGYAQNMVKSFKLIIKYGSEIDPSTDVRPNMNLYDIQDLVLTSEGTLGVISEIKLKVEKLPVIRKIIISLYKSLSDAVNVAYALYDNGITPESILIEDIIRFSIGSLGSYIDLNDNSIKALNLDDYYAALIISYSGNDAKIVNSLIEITKNIILSNKGKIIDNEKIVEIYWKSKTELPSWKGVSNLKVHSFVPALPLDKINDHDEIYSNLAEKYNLTKTGARYYILFPNLEFTSSPSVVIDDNDPKSCESYEKFTLEFAREILRLRGSPATTTGSGVRLLDLTSEYSSDLIDLMKEIKKSFDPKLLFNRNKKFKL